MDASGVSLREYGCKGCSGKWWMNEGEVAPRYSPCCGDEGEPKETGERVHEKMVDVEWIDEGALVGLRVVEGHSGPEAVEVLAVKLAIARGFKGFHPGAMQAVDANAALEWLVRSFPREFYWEP